MTTFATRFRNISKVSVNVHTKVASHNQYKFFISFLTGSLTQEFGFEEYIERLKQCLDGLGTLLIDRNIKDYVFETKTLFKKINDNYEKEFSNKFFGETNKNIGPAFYVNAVSSHQNGMLIAYLLEKTRWTSAQASCNEERAPESLLRPQNLTKNLKDLNGRFVVILMMNFKFRV
jgi:hypothetical protein